MICDKTYVEKADGRSGGVGTESQIISPKLYEDNSATQTKFAAVCTELDGGGKAYVPVYYKGRIYFDFTSPDRAEAQYEELLRWLLDKPRYAKPKLGSIPASIANPEASGTVTSSRARRAEEALRQGQGNAVGFLRDYVDAAVAELPSYKLALQKGEEHDDGVVRTFEALRPYSTEFQGVVSTLTRYSSSAAEFDVVLGGLERAAAFMYRPPDVHSWNSGDYDAYKVFTHDLFLSTFALALKEQRFDLAQAQVQRAYMIQREDRERDGRASSDFPVFCDLPNSLERRNARLKAQHLSLHADFIKGWYQGHALSFEDIMQADFVLWVISIIRQLQDRAGRWYPITLVFAGLRFAPFEVFVRSESKGYFTRFSQVLGVKGVSELKELLTSYEAEQGGIRFGYHHLSPVRLANVANLGTLA